MPLFSENKPILTRRQAFAAVPAPVPGIEALPSDDGRALLLVARRRPFRRRWLERIAPVARERRIELDEIGAQVWRRIDGRRDVRTLIHDFTAEFHVDRKEAEAAVVEFLKALMKRGLITLQVPPEP